MRQNTRNWPSYCRSTPELDQLRAHVSALLPYRVAAGVLAYLLPVETTHEPRNVAQAYPESRRAASRRSHGPARDGAPAISISLDSTFIRSRHEGERHIEVRVGNVETPGGGRQYSAPSRRATRTSLKVIGRTLETMGRTRGTRLTAFTDGCSALRSILTDVGVARTTDSRLVPHRDASPTRETGGERTGG